MKVFLSSLSQHAQRTRPRVCWNDKTSLNAQSPQRLTLRLHHNTAQQRKAWRSVLMAPWPSEHTRGSWWTPTAHGCSSKEVVGGPQTRRPQQHPTRCTVKHDMGACHENSGRQQGLLSRVLAWTASKKQSTPNWATKDGTV